MAVISMLCLLSLQNNLNSTIIEVRPHLQSMTQIPRWVTKFLIDVNAYELISRMLSPSPNACHKLLNECQQLSPIYENCG